jgi:hypothetical protein
MDPLDEIAFNDFFSYTDEKGFIYGFSITSLIELHRKKGRLTNPYNRERFGNVLTMSIMRLIRIDDILYSWPSQIQVIVSAPLIPAPLMPAPNMPAPNMPAPLMPAPLMPAPLMPDQNITNVVLNNIIEPQPLTIDMNNVIHTSEQPEIINRNINNNQEVFNSNEIRNRLIVIRKRPINTRIEEIFMEMDQLGNYTESAWLNQLQLNGYIRFYIGLLDLWSFRAQLTSITRYNICPLGDPFRGILPSQILYSNITIDIIKEACATVIESLIYTGIDVEFRRLGAFHVLTALTMVSPGARAAMPWLYDSLL